MRTILLVLAASSAFGAALGAAAAPEATFTVRLQARYCEKLRESPQAYVQFVRRLAPVHGYTYTDFAPMYPGAPVKADCRVSGERVAAVHRELGTLATAATAEAIR